jgi:hypothetical protein
MRRKTVYILCNRTNYLVNNRFYTASQIHGLHQPVIISRSYGSGQPGAEIHTHFSAERMKHLILNRKARSVAQRAANIKPEFDIFVVANDWCVVRNQHILRHCFKNRRMSYTEIRKVLHHIESYIQQNSPLIEAAPWFHLFQMYNTIQMD